jgi:hypothetical protein
VNCNVRSSHPAFIVRWENVILCSASLFDWTFQ